MELLGIVNKSDDEAMSVMCKFKDSNQTTRNFNVKLEEKKQIWVLCESSITAMGIGSYVKSAFPDYELCLCNRETFLRMGGEE